MSLDRRGIISPSLTAKGTPKKSNHKKSQGQKKIAKKITHFKNLPNFTSLNSINIAKNILTQHSQRSY